MMWKIGSLTFTGFFILTICVLAFAESEEDSNADLSNGLGDHIEWHKLEEGFALSKSERKPLMLIIHKSWCGACKSLKPKFRESKEVSEKSSAFVMVNTMDEDEPVGDVYTPDGGYIPRILFFDPDGKFLPNVINEGGNDQYKYYYFNDIAIVKSMERVISKFSENNNDTANSRDTEARNNTNTTTSQVKSEL